MDQKLTAEQVAEFKEIFSLFVKPCTDTIPAKELGCVVRSLGQTPTEAEAQDIIKKIDDAGKGNITLADFLKTMPPKMKFPESYGKIRDAFKVFDKEGDGFISADEFRHNMTNLGEKLTEREVDEFLSMIDIDVNGQIKYEDLLTKMSSI